MPADQLPVELPEDELLEEDPPDEELLDEELDELEELLVPLSLSLPPPQPASSMNTVAVQNQADARPPMLSPDIRTPSLPAKIDCCVRAARVRCERRNARRVPR